MSKIYVMAPFTEAQTEQLKQLASAYQDELFFSPGKLSMSGLGAALSGEKEPVSLSEVDAVIGNVPAKRLQEASAKEALRLSWMQLNSSGADAYVKEGILPAGTVLTSATGAYGVGIAEYMVCMLLNMMKKVPAYLEADRYPMRVYFLIGLFQCLAMIPGVSRSGATIAGGLLLKTDKRSAAEFSFFLALPTMGAAVAYDLFKNRDVLDFSDFGLIAVGFVAAFLTALVVVRFLLDFVSRRGFGPFAWWRIVVGVVGLALLQAGF